MIKDKNILVLGMARSGYEVAKLLIKYNNKIIVTDNNEQDEDKVNELKSLGINVIITEQPEKLLNNIDIVIKNPGIRRDQSAVIAAKEKNIKIINEVEAAYTFLPKDITIIGITGSNGKTTTTTIVYETLKRANLNVHLAGNIGLPLSKVALDIKPKDYLVIEISDHQLVDMYDFKTNISVLTNLSQVHLDFHKDYNQYKEMKCKIFNHHTSEDLAIINANNEDSIELTKNIPSTKLYFNSQTKSNAYLENDYLYYNEEKILNTKEIKIKGIHNYENIMCAIIILKQLNINTSYLKEFLEEFNGVEHRIEYVTKINNTSYYNDSKSTNTESTITALKSMKGSMILILGGLDRGHEFTPLNEYLSDVKKIICYGETKERIYDWSKKLNIEVYQTETLKEAVEKSKEINSDIDIVLFSPACASWDQYKDFESRGNDYKNCLNN